MPVSRPILIALAGALLAVVAFVASSSMRSSTGDEPADPAPKPAQTSAPKAAKSQAATSAPAASSRQSDSSDAAPAKADPAAPAASKPAAEAGVPARVQRAVQGGRTVVLFFFQRGGADDSATAEAVDSLRGRKGVAVFKAPVSRLGDFRAVTGSLGISQAPAVVILGGDGKDRQARVVEGFVDPQTLAQEVADTR